MALGGALAATDRRYRKPVAARADPPPDSDLYATVWPPAARPAERGTAAGAARVAMAVGVVVIAGLAAWWSPPALAQGAGASDGDPAEITESPAIEARLRAITAELRCLVCQNQTIADSHAGLAVDLRREVRALLRQGASDDAVRDYMTQRYGDFVLYRPPLKESTAMLWFGPALLLVGGLVGLVVVLRRRARLPDDRFEPDQDPDAVAASDTPGAAR
jgi:cytochrome c-type biogenesis protein CcmH